jgi:hypothetical protein
MDCLFQTATEPSFHLELVLHLFLGKEEECAKDGLVTLFLQVF